MPISNPAVQTIVNFPIPDILQSVNKDATVNSATGTKILDNNTNRRGLTIHNNHLNTVYFDTVSHNNTSTFMFSLTGGAFYEMAYPGFSDALYAISNGGTGTILAREVVATSFS
jgi:hypothetical protein